MLNAAVTWELKYFGQLPNISLYFFVSLFDSIHSTPTLYMLIHLNVMIGSHIIDKNQQQKIDVFEHPSFCACVSDLEGQ